MMDDSNFKLANIITDILDNGNTHDENAELYFIDLGLELLQRSSFQNTVNFILPSLFFIGSLS